MKANISSRQARPDNPHPPGACGILRGGPGRPSAPTTARQEAFDADESLLDVLPACSWALGTTRDAVQWLCAPNAWLAPCPLQRLDSRKAHGHVVQYLEAMTKGWPPCA